MILYIKRAFSWTDRFTVKDEQEQDRYYVQGEAFSFGRNLHVYDAQNNEVAFVRQKSRSFSYCFDVEIGGRHAFRVAREAAFLRQSYSIKGTPWHVDADFSAKEYTMQGPQGPVMQLLKEPFTLEASYALHITNPADELHCLCIMLAICAIQANESDAAAATITYL